ncbi:MAG: glycosyltransferase family 4 protein [Candidatus Omnitrophota bacterium]
MKILYLANHLNTGGITSYLLTLTVGLKERGHTVYIASGGGEALPRFLKEGIIHIDVPLKTKKEIGLQVAYSILKLKSQIRENGIEIIHAHSRTTQVAGCILSRATGAHYLSTCHGFFKPRLLRKIFPCWGERVIAISQQVKDHLTSDFKINEEIITVIHNGIDIAGFADYAAGAKEELKARFGLTGSPIVGIIARLSDVKGHAYLIQAMKAVLGRYPDAELFIVGEGKEKERLIKLVKALKIEGSVIFVPSVADTRDALSVIDIFVMPSLKEGLGLALMEAMASGLAVIGSNIGGIRTLIEDNVNGLLVLPQDVDGLAGAISGLIANPSKRASLGRAAQVFISRNFSQEKMVSETERVYLECLSAKH